MQYLILLPALAIALTVHEAAHALAAYWLGDHLAKSQGRVSLNPFRHLSLWGTLAIFVLGFGWGKPVLVNLYHFKHPKRDYLLCSLAGPASNVLFAGMIFGLLHLPLPEFVKLILVPGFIINAVLAVFNLIPIPPLDGSKIWPCLIPGMRPTLGGKLSQFGMIILLVGLYTGAINKIMRPTFGWLYHIAMAAIDDTQVYTQRPKDFPTCLFVPHDAYGVSYTVYPTKKQQAPCYSIDYVIERSYPCDSLIAEIVSHLDRHHWHRTNHFLYDPNKPSTDAWNVEKEKDWIDYDWSGDWITPGDRWLSLRISYSADANDPNDPNSLQEAYVTMYLDGPGSDDSKYYKAYQSRYPEEFNFNEPNTAPD